MGPTVKGKKRLGSALVVGGGVAGMWMAADLADTGLQVHLVEALPSLGGRAWIDPSLCHGCGTCTAGCPASAIELAGHRDEQVLSGGKRLGAWLPR